MNLKNAIILLLIGCVAGGIGNILYFSVLTLDEHQLKFQYTTLISVVAKLGQLAGFVLWGIAYLKTGTFSSTRKASHVILISTVVGILYSIYFISETYGRIDLKLNRQLVIYQFLGLFTSVGIVLFAISFVHSFQRVNRAGWWIIFAGFILLFSSFFGEIDFWISRPFANTETIVTLTYLFSLISILYPFGLVLLGAALPGKTETAAEGGLTTNSPDLLDRLEDKPEPENAQSENKIRWWLSTFLLSSIPLVGLGFLLYWSGSGKHFKRGTWAAASAVMRLFSSMFLVWYFKDLLALIVPSLSTGQLLLIVVLLMGALIIAAMVMNAKVQNNLPLGVEDDSPGVSEWFGNLLLLAIPVVGLVCLIIWSSDNQNRYRQRWAQAQLIWIGLMLICYFYLAGMLRRVALLMINEHHM